jgi:hypothetical protein
MPLQELSGGLPGFCERRESARRSDELAEGKQRLSILTFHWEELLRKSFYFLLPWHGGSGAGKTNALLEAPGAWPPALSGARGVRSRERSERP